MHTQEKQRGGFCWNLFTWKGSAASMISSGFVGSNAAKLNNLLTANANQRDVILTHVKDGDGPPPTSLLAAFSADKIEVREGASSSGGGFSSPKKQAVGKREIKLAKFEDCVAVRVPARAELLLSNACFFLDADGDAPNPHLSAHKSSWRFRLLTTAFPLSLHR